jgi:FtsZ-binding cell division protein ZapB
MSENDTVAGSGEAPRVEQTPANPEAKPPRNDAEAAQREQEAVPATPDKDAEAEKADRKRNRTREYINKLNRENAELRAERESWQQQQKTPEASKEPAIADFNFDQAAYQRALIAHEAKRLFEEQRQTVTKAQEQQRQAETLANYSAKVAEFADEHPDFMESVGSMKYPIPDATQMAIIAHDRGPEIAYHLAHNDDDAFQLASIQPHLAAAAVERLASRLTAAQQAPQQPQQPPTRHVSRAPAPVATVGGKAPTAVSPEKLTDDEWFRRRKSKRTS